MPHREHFPVGDSVRRMTPASSPRAGGSPRPRQPDRGRATRHRLVVLATDTADTVAAAGGLLFDRGSSGWNVEAYVLQSTNENAFQILGVPYAPLPQGLTAFDEWPDAVVVSAVLYRENADVRQLFAAASHQPLTEVALWGGDWPSDAGPEIGRIEHRLSAAALAFKTHAMAAVGLAPHTDAVETFRSGTRRLTIAASLTQQA